MECELSESFLHYQDSAQSKYDYDEYIKTLARIASFVPFRQELSYSSKEFYEVICALEQHQFALNIYDIKIVSMFNYLCK